MGRALLAFLLGIVAFLLILGLMLFAGVNWQTTVEVSFIFGPTVSVRLVVLLLICLAVGLLLGVSFVLRTISLSRRWKKANELKKEVKKLRPRQPRRRIFRRNNNTSEQSGEE